MKRLLWLLLPLTVLFSGCASVVPPLDPPKVTIENLEGLPADDKGLRFLITLRIANPNTQALDIAGISYDIAINKREVVSGVTNEVPKIEGYTEEVVRIESGVKLFQLLRLLADLGQQQRDSVT